MTGTAVTVPTSSWACKSYPAPPRAVRGRRSDRRSSQTPWPKWAGGKCPRVGGRPIPPVPGRWRQGRGGTGGRCRRWGRRGSTGPGSGSRSCKGLRCAHKSEIKLDNTYHTVQFSTYVYTYETHWILFFVSYESNETHWVIFRLWLPLSACESAKIYSMPLHSVNP